MEPKLFFHKCEREMFSFCTNIYYTVFNHIDWGL